MSTLKEHSIQCKLVLLFEYLLFLYKNGQDIHQNIILSSHICIEKKHSSSPYTLDESVLISHLKKESLNMYMNLHNFGIVIPSVKVGLLTGITLAGLGWSFTLIGLKV